MSKEDKFKIIKKENHVKSTWGHITPDGFHDWINKGDLAFYKHIPLAKDDATVTYTNQSVGSPEIGLYCFDHSFAGHSTGGENSKRYTSVKPTAELIPPNHKACKSLYRPFEVRWLIHKKNAKFRNYYFKPGSNTPFYNPTICVSNRTDIFSVLMCDVMPNYHLLGHTKCFPLYRHDGKSWVPNISNKVLDNFQQRYGKNVTKIQIFYYIYAVLHSPKYQSKYSNNLLRSLPRIPIVSSQSVFIRFSNLGKRLAELHCMHNIKPSKNLNIKIEITQNTKTQTTSKSLPLGVPILSITAMEIKNIVIMNGLSKVLEIHTTLQGKNHSTQTTYRVRGISTDSYDDNSAYSVDLWFQRALERAPGAHI